MPLASERNPSSGHAFFAARGVCFETMQTTSPASPALPGIQYLRAVAAVAVVFAHIKYDFAVKLSAPDLLPDNFKIGGMGVDLFCNLRIHHGLRVRSPIGHCAMMVFLSSRVARIVPLYWIMTSVMLAYVVARGFGPSNASPPMRSHPIFSFRIHARQALLIHFMGRLDAELRNVLLRNLCVCAVGAARMAIAGIAIFFIGLVITNMAYPLPLPLSHWADPVILEFVFGIIVALLYRAGFSLPLPVATVLVIAALVEIGWTLTPWHRELPRWIIAGIPACQVVAAVVLVRQSVVTLPWLARLGDASYALYLFHPAVISVARALFSRGYLIQWDGRALRCRHCHRQHLPCVRRASRHREAFDSRRQTPDEVAKARP